MAGSDACDTPAVENETGDVSLDEMIQTLSALLSDLQDAAQLQSGDILVVGASSSEVMGRRIGTSTSLKIGQAIVETILDFAAAIGIDVAFQCCEHLNRALVVERQTARRKQLVEVSAIPVPGAGGAVAASAYSQFREPCLVECIVADAGIDIGDTLIGMHLRRVAVPVRGRVDTLGQAHVTMARTRPPLIGGARAVYDEVAARRRMSN